MIGQTISHYKIIEKLGEGGMGVVYKAHDTNLERDVALKFLPSELTRDPEIKERFIHEAKATSALQHNNICTIHEIDETSNCQMFICMDYYDGETIKQKIGRGPFKVDEAVDTSMQIAQGLTKAHEKGIVHRDIKPANILITTDGTVKILDFGLAKLRGLTKLTKTGSTVGTAPYMSPEQARGETVDHRTDVWSFGVVLYEMLTGQLPFKGDYEQAIAYQITNVAPEPITGLRSGIPLELERVVNKCLEKNPDERYQTAADLIADLKHLQRTTGQSVPPSIEKRVKLATKKKRWAIMAYFLVIGIALMLIFKPFSSETEQNRKSIAVLPFKNMSDSKEDEYFSDGLTEDIITQLSKISGIEKVIARTSVMQYKGGNKSIRDIGKELDVATVLEGSVRRSGNQVRIVAQLIDATSEGHLWAETYDKEMIQVFAIQSDVAKQIASVLRAKLSPADKGRIEKKQTENTEAYELYLKGRFYWNKRTSDGFKKAVEYFKEAIRIDTNYTLAYAGLASTYAVMPSYVSQPSGEYMLMAESLANKVLKLDSISAEAYAVLGNCKRKQLDWVNAENYYRQAIELNPSYATAHQWYAGFLLCLGRFDEALKEIKLAQELDPLSLVINVNVGITYHYMRQYDKAIHEFKKILEIYPNSQLALENLGLVYERQNKLDEAIEVDRAAENWAGLARVYARSGKKNEAVKILDSLLMVSKQGYAIALGIASIYHAFGDKDKTFEWLTRAFVERQYELLLIKSNPRWDDLRTDPRYYDLLKKLRLDK